MHMGGMKFKQRGREEQAEADGTEVRDRGPSIPPLFTSTSEEKNTREISNV